MNILTFFHLCDNDSYVPRGQAGCKPVSKLSTIYSVVTAKFSSVWKSGKIVCINEGIIPLREKLISNFTIQTNLISMVWSPLSCMTPALATDVCLKTQVKRRGDKFVMNNETLLAVKFKDRTVFQMLSSVHSNNYEARDCLWSITTSSWEHGCLFMF